MSEADRYKMTVTNAAKLYGIRIPQRAEPVHEV